MFDAQPSENDPTQALLQFMIAATPEHSLADDIIRNPQPYLEKMTVVPQHTLVQDDRTYSSLIHNVPNAVSPVKARIAFVQVPHGDKTSLELVWKFEVEMEDNWYEAAVTHVAPHRIVSVVDWASDSPMPVRAPVPEKPHPRATYNVWPWGINDPSEGNRSIVREGSDKLASPAGWHALPYANDPQTTGHMKNQKGFRNTTTTWGNNVFAHENWEGENNWISNYRPDGGSDLEFDFEYDPQPTEKSEALAEAKKWIDVAVTQLFYTSNMVHDLYYRYGFDEVSGNFQQHNFGRGGRENDAVIANAQDGSGFNNANFMTPPGKSIYLFYKGTTVSLVHRRSEWSLPYVPLEHRYPLP